MRPSSTAHAGHLGEHLGLEDLLLLWDGAAGEDAAVERGCRRRVQIGRHGGQVAVIGRGGSHGLEERAAAPEGVQVALPGAYIFACDLAQLFDVLEEAGVLGVDH